jgi:alpha-1,3-glucan synthase
MIARATAPDRIGPSSVFPDASKWDFETRGLKGIVMDVFPVVIFLNALL